MALDFWYDGQLRRYWMQFIRIFEGIQYQAGIGPNGQVSYRTFPVKLAGKDRQIGHILRNNSENTILSTPQITCEMIDIEQSDERRQLPNHVSNVNIFERAIDPATGKYTNELGKTYSVERFMPVPYDMTMQVSVWTSNEMQKNQFMEQVLTLFNPSIDLQTSDNPLDWTSLTVVNLVGVQWSNRSMPIGTDSDIEIATLTFQVPVWLSPPSKVKRQNIIHQIITNIGLMNDTHREAAERGEGIHFSENDLHTRVIVTPGDLKVDVAFVGDGPDRHVEVTLLNQHGSNEINGQKLDWRKVLNSYGQYRPGVSQFRLKTVNDLDNHDSDIIGTFDFHPTKPNSLIWTIDVETLQPNTMAPIEGIIDMQGRVPGRGLPPAESGQRYMLIEDLHPVADWDMLEAHVNDIIEYDGTKWFKAFDASAVTTPHFVLNLRSNKQLRWTGEQWLMAVEGTYNPGFWRVFL